jgi:hypothetical protein
LPPLLLLRPLVLAPPLASHSSPLLLSRLLPPSSPGSCWSGEK